MASQKRSLDPQEMLALAFDEAPAGIVMTQHRIIRYYNKAFAHMFGYAGDALRDQSFAILYPSLEEFVKIGNVGLKPLRETGRYSDERIMARKDGSLFWCRVRGNSLTRDEPLAHAVWSMTDLSHERPVACLTLRERQIVMHLGEGRTSRDIARILALSPRTVEAYRARLLKKFGAGNVAEMLSNVGGMPR